MDELIIPGGTELVEIDERGYPVIRSIETGEIIKFDLKDE